MKIGMKFYYDENYIDKVNFCDKNNLEIEIVGKDEEGKTIYQIVEHQETKDDLNLLRIRREEECFPVINRGKLWYDSLTDVQIIELRHWYNAWLDVTETKVIPTKPNWLRWQICHIYLTNITKIF